MKKLMLMVVAIILVISLVSCGIRDSGQENKEDTASEKVVTVETLNPSLGSLVNETTIVGKLQANRSAVAFAQLSIPEEILEVNYKIGDYVEKDSVIVILDSESTDDQVENARLSYETARKNYNALLESVNLGKANLERTKILYEQGVASKQQLESAELQASDGQLKTVGAQLSQAKFAYENAQKAIDNTTIVAPISGVISSMNFEVDNLATSQNSLVITDLSTLEIDLMITENVLKEINDETVVTVELESYDVVLESQIVSLNPVADPMTGLYSMTISIENMNGDYKPGMFGRVHIAFSRQEMFLVSIDAVLNDADGDYLYVIEDNQPQKVYVEIGQDDGEIIEILSGINAENEIVVRGQNYITEETKVRVISGGQ